VTFNVSQGSVAKLATYTRCGGIFDMHLTANLPGNLPVKKFLNRLRIDRIMVMSLWLRFLGPPCIRFQSPLKSVYRYIIEFISLRQEFCIFSYFMDTLQIIFKHQQQPSCLQSHGNLQISEICKTDLVIYPSRFCDFHGKSEARIL